MPTRASLVLAVLLLTGGGAGAVEPCFPVPELELTGVDHNRLVKLPDSRAQGIAEARGYSGEADETIATLFENGLTPVAELSEGAYQCRTIKFGGLLPFVAYSWFACEVHDAGPGYTIEKLTGSQRFTGDLIPVGGGLVFRGADHYADEAPGAYGADPERNSVGCVSRVSPDEGSYLLELPLPFLESTHDVIELRPSSETGG